MMVNTKAAAAWRRIKHYPLGGVPPDLPDRWPRLYRCIVAKRALLAGYEDADESPEDTIADLLTDMRHLCDRLGLAYGDMDALAQTHYVHEFGEYAKK